MKSFQLISVQSNQFDTLLGKIELGIMEFQEKYPKFEITNLQISHSNVYRGPGYSVQFYASVVISYKISFNQS